MAFTKMYGRPQVSREKGIDVCATSAAIQTMSFNIHLYNAVIDDDSDTKDELEYSILEVSSNLFSLNVNGTICYRIASVPFQFIPFIIPFYLDLPPPSTPFMA